MSGFQTPITIKQALDRVSKNQMLLPAFQREFVWTPDQISNLFDSMMKDYPFSSLLFWKVSGDDKKNYQFYPFVKGFREFFHTFEHKMDTENINDFHAVLDGQQRLTAMYIGFRGSYAYKGYRQKWEDNEHSLPTRKFYINLTKKNDENKFNFNFFTSSESNCFSDLFVKDECRWFRVGCIENIPSLRKYNGSDGIELNDSELDVLEILSTVLTKPLINFYEIEGKTHDEAVNIFIRINSGGTHLSYSAIMFSMVIAGWSKTDAKKEFFSLVQDISNLGFTINNDYILRAFLYLFNKEVKFDLNLFSNEFIVKMEKLWPTIRESIKEVYRLIKSYGFFGSTLTSNLATLPILYYIYHTNFYIDFSQKVAYKNDREIIKKWLLVVLVRKVFGGSTDTVLKQSRQAFTDDIDKKYISVSLKTFPDKTLHTEIKRISTVGEDFIIEILGTQKDHVQAFSILALLYPQLDYKNGDFHKDHIHPISLCEKNRLDFKVANSILNLQLLDANENKSKNDSELDLWILGKNLPAIDLQRFLTNQHIPHISLSINDFEIFIEERKKILVAYLLKVLN